MRHQPALVRRIAEEAAAHMIIETAQDGRVHGGGDELDELLDAGAQIGAPENLQENRLGKFHIADLAAQENVVALTDAHAGDVELDGLGLAAHVAVQQIGHPLISDLGALSHVVGLVAVERGHVGEDAAEGRLIQPVFLGQIAGDEIGIALGVEEEVERPAALVTHGIGGGLVKLIEIGALEPVGDHRNEILVDLLGDFGIGEALPVHHMAPMAGGVTQGQEDGLSFLFGLGQDVVAPYPPRHGIVLVRQEIGAGGGVESTHRGFHWKRR